MPLPPLAASRGIQLDRLPDVLRVRLERQRPRKVGRPAGEATASHTVEAPCSRT